MQTWKDVARCVREGHRVTVEFQREIEQQEGYIESGMRGVLIAVREEDQTCLSFVVDLGPFESFNLPFEKANYFDSQGAPCLTARQANQYPKNHRESMWVDENDAIGVPATVVDDEALQIFAEYCRAAPGVPYTHWLEHQVRALRAGQGAPE